MSIKSSINANCKLFFSSPFPDKTHCSNTFKYNYVEFIVRFIIWMKSNEMASTGDIWVQWFTCCFHQPQSPTRRQRHQRMRIDRSMIGNPTNFVHTGEKLFDYLQLRSSHDSIHNFEWNFLYILGHIGSNDSELTPNHINAIQSQMQSKGGYEMNSLRIQVIDPNPHIITSLFRTKRTYLFGFFLLQACWIGWSLECNHIQITYKYDSLFWLGVRCLFFTRSKHYLTLNSVNIFSSLFVWFRLVLKMNNTILSFLLYKLNEMKHSNTN